MKQGIDHLVRKAEMAIENLVHEFDIESRRNACHLRESWSKAGSESDPVLKAECFRIAHDIKGQSSTFGYPLLSEVASSLCRLLQTRPAKDKISKWAAAVGCHIDAVELITTDQIKGDGGQTGTALLAALQAAMVKIGADRVPLD